VSANKKFFSAPVPKKVFHTALLKSAVWIFSLLLFGFLFLADVVFCGNIFYTIANCHEFSTDPCGKPRPWKKWGKKGEKISMNISYCKRRKKGGEAGGNVFIEKKRLSTAGC